MYLREYLKEYVEKTLKPFEDQENISKTKNRNRNRKNDVVYDLENVSISQYDARLPKFKPDILRTSNYYMNNRTKFIKFFNDLYKNYKPNPNSNENFDILFHQKLVRDYLSSFTPYRGLLVYHNLGTGKSCTSIAVAEGMNNTNEVFILSPASLEANYWAELQKCGNFLYQTNNHWSFVSTEGNPNLIPVLAKALNLNPNYVSQEKGAWMVDVSKDNNYDTLSVDEQNSVQKQIIQMINRKYIPIHYNASNLQNVLTNLSQRYRNLFDNSVIIVDEAHNLVTKIVNNINKGKSTSPYVELYKKILGAQNSKIVLLSGTPIINEPNEVGVLFNMIRGYIYTWEFNVKRLDSGKVKINSEFINKLLNDNNCTVHDYVEYSGTTITITRNPYGFVNVNNKNSNNITAKSKPNTNRTSKKNMYGGYGEYGITLNNQGNISNDEFIKMVKNILDKNGLKVEGKPKMTLEKCLPDKKKEFIDNFIKKTTNYSDKKNKESDLLKIQTLRRRMVGLTSYFRSQKEGLLPDFIKDSRGNIYNEIKVPMSDYQFGIYAKSRKVEIEKEKKLKTMRGKQRNVQNSELFQISSTYRSSSRTCCNFAFPPEIPRPSRLVKGNDDDETDDNNVDEEYNLESSKEYKEKIDETLVKLKENSKKIYSESGLKNYSPKMLEIIRRIKNREYRGLHLLYSAFRTLEGIGIFQQVLEEHGFQQFKIKQKDNSWELDFEMDGRPCYVLYTGTEKSEYREIIRNIYNGNLKQPEVPKSITDKITGNNYEGDIIKLFMITAAGAEGINLKNTRYVHIMEPFWHNVRLEQVVGRARRLNSHIDLDENLRTVQVFLYLSVMKDSHRENENFKEIQVNDLSKIKENKAITTDEYLYEISQMKQKINNQVLQLIKETAMDCHIHSKEHKKNESLICYGQYDSVSDKNFIGYPTYKMDIKQDSNKDFLPRNSKEDEQEDDEQEDDEQEDDEQEDDEQEEQNIQKSDDEVEN
jgi:hypothetical protein